MALCSTFDAAAVAPERRCCVIVFFIYGILFF